MLSSTQIKGIVAEARPIIERMLDDAELIAGFRTLVAEQGGDWSALKALIKAQIQDERDEGANGKRVRKIVEKAEFASAYADMLGLGNMNEQNNFERSYAEAKGRTESGRAEPVRCMATPVYREYAGTSSDENPAPIINTEMDRATEGSFETGSEAAENARKAGPKWVNGSVSHAGAGESPATSFLGPHSQEVDDGQPHPSSNVSGAKNDGAQTIVGRADDRSGLSITQLEQQDASASQDRNEPISDSEATVTHSNTTLATSPDASRKAGEGSLLPLSPAANPDDDVPDFLKRDTAPARKTAADFRPNCLRPDACASSGLHHCYQCEKASQDVEGELA